MRAAARGARFALSNAGFKERVIQKNIDGFSFDFLIGDRCGEDWYSNWNHLSPELAFLKSMLSEGDVVVECGTHHGFTTLLMAHWIGDHGCITGYEASPSSAAIARRNVELNGLGARVKIEPKAVGAKNGSILITNESNAVAVGSSSFATKEVECVTLDSYRGPTPTLIKLDVEGFELDVLKGAAKVLESKPKLAIEVHVELLRRFGRSADEVLDYVPQSAYDLWIQLGEHEEPKRYAGQSLSALTMEQVHLYAFARGRD